MKLLHVPEAMLYRSEPPPYMFGNPQNEASASWTNANWLKSRFHFSFAEYRNPKNTQFGCLRVLNDDLVQARRGFGRHPHRDMEIVTYVVDGVLTHADSMGTDEALGRGSVQFMTAGTGVQHEEHNKEAEPLRFIQIWIQPRSYGLTPNYGSYDGTTKDAQAARKNRLLQLVGDAKQAAHADVPVRIQQDCSMFVSEMDPNTTLEFTLKAGRQVYLVCVEGTLSLAGEVTQTKLERHDAAEIREQGKLRLSSGETPTHLLLLEMAEGPGGRGDGKWPLHLG
ncbi:hypothetical protein AB1Y20_001109 [Prymnesium parvum]|uniref:Pirin n=1 Tax=Prymnesium parvum TaxID=97485 RepID=A0AB34K6T4_PRYPA